VSPGRVSRIVVADKIALVRRMLQGLGTLLTQELGDLEAVIASVTAWMLAHPDRVADAE
jgi:hypothetical protein